jgi:hypothetical protein
LSFVVSPFVSRLLGLNSARQYRGRKTTAAWSENGTRITAGGRSEPRWTSTRTCAPASPLVPIAPKHVAAKQRYTAFPQWRLPAADACRPWARVHGRRFGSRQLRRKRVLNLPQRRRQVGRGELRPLISYLGCPLWIKSEPHAILRARPLCS